MSSRLALVLVVVFFLLAGAAIVLWPSLAGRAPATLPDGAPVPAAGDWYEVVFTQPRFPDEAASHRGGIDERLVGLIDSAQRSLDVAIYDFDLQNVAQAMARAAARGVAVRMVTDTDTLDHKDEAIQGSLAIVRRANIDIVADERSAIMHHKFVVVDRKVVLTGSWNFTTGDTYRLNNHAVIIRSPEMAENFTGEFEQLFVKRSFGPNKTGGVAHPRVTIGQSRIETYFASADDPSQRLIELIRGARSRIEFLAFSFTHEGIGAAVLDRGKAGVKVRGVFETTGSETRFSEFPKLKQAGLEVYQDGNPYVMHHKVFVVDDRITVFGSFNFSDNAANSNDENLIIVDDPGFARTFLQEVERIVAQAKRPLGRGSVTDRSGRAREAEG